VEDEKRKNRVMGTALCRHPSENREFPIRTFRLLRLLIGSPLVLASFSEPGLFPASAPSVSGIDYSLIAIFLPNPISRFTPPLYQYCQFPAVPIQIKIPLTIKLTF